MKIKLFPEETRGLELLEQMATEILAGIQTFSQMLGSPAEEHPALGEAMHLHESKVLDLHFAVMTHMRTSFLNPLPREDLYTISLHLSETIRNLDGAAEIIVLNKLSHFSARATEQLDIISSQAQLTRSAMARLESLDELEEYWIEMIRLTKRAERTHLVWTAELINDHKFIPYRRQRDLADQLAKVIRELRYLAAYVGRILVKES